MFEPHREALSQIFKLPRPTVRETAIFALLYIVQAIACITVLKFLYAWTGWLGAMWAMVAAVLSLQPGTAQSLATSVVRILANAVGAAVGFGVGHLLGDGLMQLLVAITLVVIICECLRLDLALRTACVAVLIVLTANDGNVRTSSLERVSAVLIGCALVLAIQTITDVVRHICFSRWLPAPAEVAAAAPERGKQSTNPA